MKPLRLACYLTELALELAAGAFVAFVLLAALLGAGCNSNAVQCAQMCKPRPVAEFGELLGKCVCADVNVTPDGGCR